MPTTIDSAGITFNDATSLTSAVLAANSVGATQITNGSVTAAKLGTTEQKQICKAWVNFNGTNAFSPNPSTSAIRSSYNVSSITKNGNGDYTVNFTTAMNNTDYGVTFGSGNGIPTFNAECLNTREFASNYIRIVNRGVGLAVDPAICCVAIFGN
jgi:hypothetical protein